MTSSPVSRRRFIDCSYEGDLMARAGVSYTWGRESRDEYGESLDDYLARQSNAEESKDRFTKCDKDKDGLLSREEFIKGGKCVLGCPSSFIGSSIETPAGRHSGSAGASGGRIA